MKRVLTYLISGIIVLAIAACLGTAVWLTGTTAGARWLLTTISRYTDLTLSVKSMEGKLAGTLALEHLDISWPQGHVRVEQARITMRPLGLLTGEVDIQTLFLKNVVITDNAPAQKPDLTWPRVSGWIVWWSAGIRKLTAENLVYHSPEKQPLHFTKIEASVLWKNAQLAASDIRMVSEDGTFTGNILAGFSRPLLEMNVAASLSHPAAGLEFFGLAGKFTPGKHPEQMAGSLYVSGKRKRDDAKPSWELSLDAAMTRQDFLLRKIRMILPEKSGLITAEGLLTFNDTEPFLSLQAETAGVDLSFLTGLPEKIAGGLVFRGTRRQYEGTLRLDHFGKDRPSLHLTGNYQGNSESLTVNVLRGDMLEGTLSGRLSIDWRQGLTIEGELAGRHLNPSALDENWAGEINFDLTGHFSAPQQGSSSGDVLVSLKESDLHGQKLTGDLRASFTSDDIRIQHLLLRGKGFEISASGALQDKLNFNARADDLSRLLPEISGSLRAQGFVRRRQGKISGVVSARAQGLMIDDLDISAADLSASFTNNDKDPLRITLALHKIRYQQFQADVFTLRAYGTLGNHTLNAALRRGRYETNLAATGVYDHHQWQGKISRLDGTDKVGRWRLVQPAGLVITSDSLSLDPLTLTGENAESLKASCRWTKEPRAGAVSLNWTGVNLARTSAWLHQEFLAGITDGQVQLNLRPQKQIDLNGKASLRGTLFVQGKPVGIRESTLTVDGSEKGLHADFSLLLAGGGILQGDFSSSAPASLSLPEEGHFNLQLRGVDATLLHALLPQSIQAEGQISGRAEGRLLPDRRMVMTGHASATPSKIVIQGKKGHIRMDLRQISLDWIWRDETLSGNLALTLTDQGKLAGPFSLPIAARLGAVIDKRRGIDAALAGQVREKGALSVLFPGLIQESHGDLDVDLKLGGSMDRPQLAGNIRLSKAGGYLPASGITIKEASLDARFDKDTIFIDTFRAASGPGYVEGSAVIRLNGYQIKNFEGRLDGERFQTIYFPELQVQSSPKLTFSGTPEKIAVRGDLLLPVVQVVGTQARGPMEASPDVIREGKTKPAGKKLPFDLDARIKLILGDSVFFNAAGIDAQLGGSIDLQFQEFEKIISSGEIRVVKGTYRTYGVNLNIVRGRLYYASAPVNQPSLDILALKTVGEVRAGVAVSGRLQTPLIKLYSEPAMQDMDILAYIVLGHPLGRNTDQAALLAMAARALLTSKQAEDLQSQIKGRLGLGSFEISAGAVDSSGKMGYKPVKTSPGGALPNSSEGIAETMVTVGRYLTPNLYISYGRSLFTGANLLFLRYNLSKDWQVESQTGQESGVDIYYKLEFN